ncbi:DUF7521 family protein [Halorarum salinum]|uniref:Uncharacterized protein n=1 Tax=Halorarum salinum TaxID=2743089 RepID=A0A7D5QE46_9EURY|nr:hypothetical protein [Halobaculum salinum]QLG60483.1 hypothetical protein HUG12_01435 [Halobaculum salinum]
MTAIELVALTTTALTALAGLLVAGQAYRGYRRNDSSRMRALAVGIVIITVAPALITEVLAGLAQLTDAQTLVGVLFTQAVGLLAIYRSLG